MSEDFEAMLGHNGGPPLVDPYRVPESTIVSFSGGRTSGYMLYRIIQAFGGKLPPHVKVIFANTGKEHEATLRFVQDCSIHWGVDITWVEFDPAAEHQTRIVTFETAARNGEPLADIIATRPTQHLFNPVSRYCSVTAKVRRIHKYANKWLDLDKWFSATGLRADETKRVDKGRARWGRDRQWPIFPLADDEVTKEIVAEFWAAQPFDLQLPNVGGVTPLGNCVLCPLKSKGKLVNVLRKMPEEAEWWIEQEVRMESTLAEIPYASKPRSRPVDYDDPSQGVIELPPLPDRRHRFFKDGTSYRDLLLQAQLDELMDAPMDEGFEPPIDCTCHD